jgi:hypothetical protein
MIKKNVILLNERNKPFCYLSQSPWPLLCATLSVEPSSLSSFQVQVEPALLESQRDRGPNHPILLFSTTSETKLL